MTKTDIEKLIFKGGNPYSGFDPSRYYYESIETHINSRRGEISPSFYHSLKFVKDPKLLLEVGSYQGASAIFFAKEFNRLGIDCQILCVDTFIGSITHWTNDFFFNDLKLENGFPTLYKQFLANVMKHGCYDKITPLPLTSLDGARFLNHNDICPDLIYIDASHEYPDVLLDITAYYKTLKVGGVIFGDDYDGWPGVKQSVDQFGEDMKIQIEVINGKWFIRK